MGFLLGLLGGTANVILTTILSLAQSIGGGIMSIAKQGMDAMMQYHDKSIQFARSVGMTYKESQAYANVLIDIWDRMENKTDEKVEKNQKNDFTKIKTSVKM